MLIPYGKDNTDKKAIPHDIYLTIGPMPINAAVSAMSQAEEQGWKTKTIVFAGTQKNSTIAMASQPSFPVYFVIIYKVFCEGEEMVDPKIRL
jgi:hypothetical protein